MADELPQWILNALTDIKMSARDRGMTDAEFFAQITSFLDQLNEQSSED